MRVLLLSPHGQDTLWGWRNFSRMLWFPHPLHCNRCSCGTAHTTMTDPIENRPRRRLFALSLRETLFLGAALGIFLPALVLAFFQVNSKLQSEVELRIRAPMQQQAAVLARSLGMAIWNVDQRAAEELVDAVMRNPDVVSVDVTDEFKQVFAAQDKPLPTVGELITDSRDIVHEGAHVGHLQVVMTTERIQRELIYSLVQMAVALVAQVGISIGLIWLLFEQRMVRPLKKLQADAQRLARGQLEAPLHWTRQDEMGSLAQGLEAMRSELVVSIKERDQKNVDLQTELVERKRIETALGVSQAKFEAIFNASPVAMTVSTLTDVVLLVDVNAAWTRMFGCSREDVLGDVSTTKSFWLDPSERTAVRDAMLRDGSIERHRTRMRRNGSDVEMLCEVSGSRVRTGDDALMILAYDDITAKHRSEQEILQLNATLEQRVAERTQELTNILNQLTAAQTELVRSEKLSALGAMVAGIAHELNTPIGNSLTVASTLQDHTNAFANAMGNGLTRSRLDEFVQSSRQGTSILMRSLHHAAELVASFKQVAVDQTSLNRRVFRLKETLHEILLTLGPTLRKTTHTVECHVPDDITLDSYPGPLGQVITNLIHNALVHAFEGRQNGKVVITVTHGQPGWVSITVADNGNGIPVAHLDKVFDPFFTTKLGKGGSGLGLNIVYNLVTTTLCGRIEVRSAPDEGACFTLALPLHVA